MHEIMSCQTRTGALPGAAACTMGRRSRHLVAEGGTTVAQIAARTFLNELDAQHVPYELMPHPRTETALADAGRHDESLRIKTKDLVRITGALLGDLCAD